MTTKIERKDHSFVMEKDGQEVGKVNWTVGEGGVWMVDHTFVAESMRGQHAGEQLVEQVVELARKEGVKIDPVCPFAAALFKRKKEYSDVWQQD
ncbi:GNAT family N-acetyltransferase [Saccharibacillus sp. JS10]|uniref:GNAT family N-acetyltransferase n=1 Tax=Saccharibacillus sp. JS10 TaxID=2950552 RepID=UPI0021095645|nr:GNAT family N-acetyltransferase [Saccharibacillus sp. JS10]MCQ4087577.1 N-acetyltransferase [Saccharibacillus sp. JS10]